MISINQKALNKDAVRVANAVTLYSCFSHRYHLKICTAAFLLYENFQRPLCQIAGG